MLGLGLGLGLGLLYHVSCGEPCLLQPLSLLLHLSRLGAQAGQDYTGYWTGLHGMLVRTTGLGLRMLAFRSGSVEIDVDDVRARG